MNTNSHAYNYNLLRITTIIQLYLLIQLYSLIQIIFINMLDKIDLHKLHTIFLTQLYSQFQINCINYLRGKIIS